MNKEDLINAIAAETEFSKTDSRKYLEALTKVIPEALAKGEFVQLIGFANFSVAERTARKGRNPRTGKEIEIAASKVVKFSAGKTLKEALNPHLVNVKAETKKPVTKKK
jgi:DNA-binding protein HU-beta